MSARPKPSSVVYLPSTVAVVDEGAVGAVPEERFLRNVADLLERLQSESELRGHSLLASLLAITKGEAEDGLRTSAKALRILSRGQDHDDGVVKMAQKLACAGPRS